ncbi:glycerophosphodiester phosphodiesterase family protein [Cognatishimia activa]|uniref:glycerophosphodiester phosphodiesterase family protein n=1 Tax=Cognatishimia activa TaxID=1715691 RepID=UPI0022326D37|nr:glycerophosphodiester phosphodiesterase family protein [Cognatishimia activa]UZD90540.1 phosphodiesterase [Cognatishimia activa]
MTQLDPIFLTTPIAHRALHDVKNGRPENSRAAIQAAIDAGYGIEIDLQLSQDQMPMVFHDYDLARLAECKGPVQQKTSQELASIPLIGGDETIPDLKEVLELIDGQVPLLIELKDQDGQMGENVGALEVATADLLRSYDGPVALMSFNPNTVAALAQLCPNIPRGLVTSSYKPDVWAPLSATVCDRLRDIPDYDRVGATFISHEVSDLKRARVAELKAQGARVLCWTVTSPKSEAQAREVAENITFEQYLAQHPA